MLPLFPLLLAAVAGAAPVAADRPAQEWPFEITSNKPFVPVSVNGSAPQWFILDTGCAGGSVIARECADRLGLRRAAEERQHLGAGAGVSVGVSTTPDVTLRVGPDTLGAPELRVFTLAHVERFEGRRLDGLLGEDFLRRHVVEIDYARRRIRVRDAGFAGAARRGTVVPVELESGLAIARGTLAPPGRTAIPCRLIVDTGVRGTVILFRPFAERHRLAQGQARLLTATVGGGAGGETRGDVGRLDRLSLGAVPFLRPTAVFSRDTTGVFASEDPDGIVGGELLRRCRVTFDYPHGRIVLEPYAGAAPPFEYDMSGMFLTAEGGRFERLVVFSVAEGTPAAAAGLRKGDEIVAIDGRAGSALTLDGARELFRAEGARRHLEVRRGDKRFAVVLVTKRLV